MNLKTIEKNWVALRAAADVGPIRDAAHYTRTVALADAITTSGKAGEGGALEGLFLILCDLIEDYDRAHYPVPAAAPRELLRQLMAEHGLTQAQLPGLGGQGVVSQLLSGKRAINARQALALARLFKLPAGVFLDAQAQH